MDFTAKQKRAIETHGKSLLVSAAAGSGKTSVLTSRIVSLIESGETIEDMAVLTFTNAAASEMRSRIAAKLTEIKKLPDCKNKKHCAKEAEKVLGANIGTFHKISKTIISENFEMAGVSFDVKQLGETQMENMKNEAMDALCEECFENGNQDFLQLISAYGNRGRKTKVCDCIDKIYSFIMSRPNSEEWLKNACNISLEEYCACMQTPEDIADGKSEYGEISKRLGQLCRLVLRYKKIYEDLKHARNVIDYDDMLHMALLVVKQKDCRFKFVFVDEYQDTNPLQEEIVKHISYPENCFMVGDIKQSIYRFNHATPQNFMRKYDEFMVLDEEKIVAMNENFRCSKQVVDFINYIMENIMTREMGGTDYDENERLIFKSGNSEGLAEFIFGGYFKNKEERVLAESEIIARKISGIIGQEAMINGEIRKITPGDITILIRSRDDDFIKALKNSCAAHDIPLTITTKEKENVPEIELFVQILKMIEDAKKDIPLIAVMRSFVGGFSDEELAQIRTSDKADCFYNAMHIYIEENQNNLCEKLKNFTGKIAYLKECSRAMDMPSFIREVISGFEYTDFVSLRKTGRNETFLGFLGVLYEIAEREGQSLYALLDELETVKKNNDCYVEIKAEDRGNSVTVQTMHGSKGLEFPVVFVSNLARNMESKEYNAGNMCVLHNDYGILLLKSDEKRLVRKISKRREILTEKIKNEDKSEELRLLYVAMTRAKCRLYMTGCYSRTTEEKNEMIFNQIRNGNPFAASCMLDFLMAFCTQESPYPMNIYSYGEEALAEQKLKENFDVIFEGEGSGEFITAKKSLRIPTKLSVSEIKEKEKTQQIYYSPVFQKDEFSGAKLGTLAHLILEKNIFGEENCADTAKRLLEKQIISEEEYSAAIKNSALVDAFFNTPLAQRIANSRCVIKEQPFNFCVPANSIGYEGSDEITIQGVIDLAFKEEEKWVLVDYKTDRINDKNADSLKKIYKKQTDIYSQALEQVTKIPVKERILYFLRENLAVSV